MVDPPLYWADAECNLATGRSQFKHNNAHPIAGVDPIQQAIDHRVNLRDRAVMSPYMVRTISPLGRKETRRRVDQAALK
jgi:hypothetical protein